MTKNNEEQTTRKISEKQFALLPNAIEDGKLIASVGDELVVTRPSSGKMQRCICSIKSINGVSVETFDMTRGQWFIFETVGLDKYGIVVKKLTASKEKP